MLYPSVRGYGDYNVESFESYFARWPEELRAIPRQVVEDWVHRHWQDFKQHWAALSPHKWVYRIAAFSNDDLLRIGHI